MEDVNSIIGSLAAATSAQHVTRGWPAADAVELEPLKPQDPALTAYLLSILRIVLPLAMLVAPGNAPQEVLAGANVVQISLADGRDSFPACCGNPCGGPATPLSLAALKRSLSEAGFEVAMDAPVWN